LSIFLNIHKILPKVFPLAVIRAREAEADRKRTMRQYEAKEQKLSQLRKYNNQDLRNDCIIVFIYINLYNGEKMKTDKQTAEKR